MPQQQDGVLTDDINVPNGIQDPENGPSAVAVPSPAAQFSSSSPAPPEYKNENLKYNKLEKLLAQPDIFDTLRKIGSGQIRSYDDLDINAAFKRQQLQDKMKILRH